MAIQWLPSASGQEDKEVLTYGGEDLGLHEGDPGASAPEDSPPDAATAAYQAIEETLVGYLGGLEPEARIGRIDDLLHRLNFERRLAGLTEYQLARMNDRELSEAQLARLDQCKTKEGREEVISIFARAQYFRDCAWLDYLNGVCDDPPSPAEPPGQVEP